MKLLTFTALEITNKFIRIPKTESKLLKEQFEEAFCDIESGSYIDYKREFGYMLWDCMIGGPVVLTIEQINTNPPFTGDVYVFWDVPEMSKELHILGRDYVHKMTFKEFMLNFYSFPQETYVFNEEFQHAIVLSHEYFHEHLQNFCLYTPAEKDNWYKFC
ncbi:hypothetical protein [Paenibacillus arenilitoris]|uniref:Uncharacterized protein n=1 Tax=Paenibacillus arenilitoris TaxID=2772299 RepID=A0A927H951_9BACL|nr:hypothetical protein [Paenibacillus arenilitoris]MBD2872267.1 hypothetical protein [Paenibacillus arenilitoris]